MSKNKKTQEIHIKYHCHWIESYQITRIQNKEKRFRFKAAAQTDTSSTKKNEQSLRFPKKQLYIGNPYVLERTLQHIIWRYLQTVAMSTI